MKKINTIIAAMLLSSLIANVWLWRLARQEPEVKVETHTEYITIHDTVPKMAESHWTGETMTVTAVVQRPTAYAAGTTAGSTAGITAGTTAGTTSGTTAGITAVHQHAANHEPDMPAMELGADTAATVCVIGDSATVTLPVEQRVYEDSLYTAYVSGYRPRLDSILLRMPHTYTTITKTMSKPFRRWAVGPTVGAGYGLVGKQADVFVGVSVTWNVLP